MTIAEIAKHNPGWAIGIGVFILLALGIAIDKYFRVWKTVKDNVAFDSKHPFPVKTKKRQITFLERTERNKEAKRLKAERRERDLKQSKARPREPAQAKKPMRAIIRERAHMVRVAVSTFFHIKPNGDISVATGAVAQTAIPPLTAAPVAKIEAKKKLPTKRELERILLKQETKHKLKNRRLEHGTRYMERKVEYDRAKNIREARRGQLPLSEMLYQKWRIAALALGKRLIAPFRKFAEWRKKQAETKAQVSSIAPIVKMASTPEKPRREPKVVPHPSVPKGGRMDDSRDGPAKGWAIVMRNAYLVAGLVVLVFGALKTTDYILKRFESKPSAPEIASVATTAKKTEKSYPAFLTKRVLSDGTVVWESEPVDLPKEEDIMKEGQALCRSVSWGKEILILDRTQCKFPDGTEYWAMVNNNPKDIVYSGDRGGDKCRTDISTVRFATRHDTIVTVTRIGREPKHLDPSASTPDPHRM